MKNERSLKLRVVAITIVAMAVFMVSAAEEQKPFAPMKPKPDKICPITFHLDPATSLQRNFAAHIERTNAILAQTLADLRLAVLGDAKNLPNYNEKNWVLRFGDTFNPTYLKNPILWGDDGKLYKGWIEIIPYLAWIIPGTTYLTPQSVNVYLEYLPINSNLHKMYNKGIYATPTWDLKGPKDLEGEIDFLASIRTVIAYAPYDDPMEIGNAAPIPHRKSCDPIY